MYNFFRLTDKIVLPNNHKDLGNSFLYLLQTMILLIVRGHFIDSKHLLRTVLYVIHLKNKGGANNNEFGYRFLKLIQKILVNIYFIIGI